MSDKPNIDLKGVRKLSLQELRERRKARETGAPLPGPSKRETAKVKRREKRERLQSRKTKRYCITLTPELKLRAERDLGHGSFSRAVREALIKCLTELDEIRLALRPKD